MAELVTLTQDGPLGKAGTQVWVDDPAQALAPEGWAPPADPKSAKKVANDAATATSEDSDTPSA